MTKYNTNEKQGQQINGAIANKSMSQHKTCNSTKKLEVQSPPLHCKKKWMGATKPNFLVHLPLFCLTTLITIMPGYTKLSLSTFK